MRRRPFKPLRGIGAVVRDAREEQKRQDDKAARAAMMRLLASHGGRHRDVLMVDGFDPGFVAGCDIESNFGSIPRGTRVGAWAYRDFIEDLRFR